MGKKPQKSNRYSALELTNKPNSKCFKTMVGT